MSTDYENPWTYLERTFDSSDVGDYFGFVYEITNLLNGRRYIGRKYFWSFRTPKGKKRKVKQESDWKKYYGSCPELKEDIIKYGKQNFSRTIIRSLHKTKGKTNFEETRQLFGNNVLTESLDDGTPDTTIATSSQDTSEKITMEKTSEEIVCHIREWSIDRIADMHEEVAGTQYDMGQLDDAYAIYKEFEEWIEPEGEDIELLSLEDD